MRKYKVAMLQMVCDFLEKEKNIEKAIKLIETATKNGAKLICLPEVFNIGYNGSQFEKMLGMSEDIEGPTLTIMKETAKRLGIYLVAPILYTDSEGSIKNTAFFIDDTGKVLGEYSKTHLLGVELPHLKKGDEYPVIKTEIGNISLLICYDVCFPETARVLALKGAEIIIVPSAWRASHYFKEWWDLSLACRALDNLVYVAATNRVGSTGDDEIFAGKSQILNPLGQVLAMGTVEKEEILYADIDLDNIKKERDFNTVLTDRKPEDYEILTKKQVF